VSGADGRSCEHRHVPALIDLTAAAALVPDGASLGIGRPPALALIRELIRQGRRDLHLVAAPISALGIELLVAAGCASVVESSGVDLGEWGQAPAFADAVEAGRLKVRDWTCPALLMALQAGASGVSFTPVPGLIGSDLMRVREDFREVDDPFRAGRRVALVPALRPDFAVVHATRADPKGNAVISTLYDDRLLIQASGTVIMSVERVEAGATDRLSPDEQVVPAAYLAALTLAPAVDVAAETAAYREERARALQR